MTSEDYQALVKRTLSFKELNSVDQARILAAEGKERDFYVKIYQEENQILQQAMLQFINESHEVIKKFKLTAKQGFVDKLKRKEAKIRQVEQNKLDKLLKNIN